MIVKRNLVPFLCSEPQASACAVSRRSMGCACTRPGTRKRESLYFLCRYARIGRVRDTGTAEKLRDAAR